LAETHAGILNLRGRDGAKLGIRIGADGKGAQSIIPPSPSRQWLVGLDECNPAPLPDIVVQRILSAVPKLKSTNGQASSNGHASPAALAAMLRHKPGTDEHDSSNRLLAVCCRAIEFDLSDESSISTIRDYETHCPSATAWSDEEILRRLRDAEQRAERGSAITISNYTTREIEDDDGEKKTIIVPVSMTEIIDSINHVMGDWPRRVDSMLFVDDQRHGLDYFDKRTTAALFGWLRRRYKVTWGKGGNLVSQAELFAEIERTTRRYDAIEVLPHEPPISGIYYRGKAPDPGDGSHLCQLLDRFRPETTIDRDLIQAAMMTAFWGGLPG